MSMVSFLPARRGCPAPPDGAHQAPESNFEHVRSPSLTPPSRTRLTSLPLSSRAGFILTSEAVPQSPSGLAFGGLKGRSRRRISDLPLGLGRPTDQAPTNQKRFASAMTFVEESSEGARTPLKRADPKDEKVPSTSVAEHEVSHNSFLCSPFRPLSDRILVFISAIIPSSGRARRSSR